MHNLSIKMIILSFNLLKIKTCGDLIVQVFHSTINIINHHTLFTS